MRKYDVDGRKPHNYTAIAKWHFSKKDSQNRAKHCDPALANSLTGKLAWYCQMWVWHKINIFARVLQVHRDYSIKLPHWNFNPMALYHFHIQIAKFSTCKLCFKPKSQKNVPANNCHSKCSENFTIWDTHSHTHMHWQLAHWAVIVPDSLQHGVQHS